MEGLVTGTKDGGARAVQFFSAGGTVLVVAELGGNLRRLSCWQCHMVNQGAASVAVLTEQGWSIMLVEQRSLEGGKLGRKGAVFKGRD
jgi:hypothetical protein